MAFRTHKAFGGTRCQTFLSLQKHWLTLSMQPSAGDGGTCYGDSGGPHFLGGVESNLLVPLTVTGDAMCRATAASGVVAGCRRMRRR